MEFIDTVEQVSESLYSQHRSERINYWFIDIIAKLPKQL